MAAVGLVGPASPWVGGIASFTASLAGELSATHRVEWLLWRVPRLRLPTTHVDPAASAGATADAVLAPYDVRTWSAAGRRLRDCRAVVLTLASPLTA
jgi:hypothetical protein